MYYRNLRNGILAHAVAEYKSIVKGELPETIGCSIAEIEAFFKSDYCAVLLCDVDVDGAYIVRQLREWREEYLEQVERQERAKGNYKISPVKY